jgi:hypothetical protein
MCYCVVPKYVGVVIMYAPLTVGSSPCACSSVAYRSVYVDLIRWHSHVMRKVGYTIQCNHFSESETGDDRRVRTKHVVRKKGDNNKLQCRRKYIA